MMHRTKRAHVRHKVTRFVWFQTVDADGAIPIEGLSYLLDLSVNGLGFVSQRAVVPGTLVFVKAVLESMQHSLSAVARVVYCNADGDGNYSIGLMFVALPPDSRQFLATQFG